VEADLSRFHGIDIRDRWRFEHGRRVLTLRMIAVRVRHLPADSAVRTLERDGQPAWNLEHVLLAHVWQAAAHSKTPHPALASAAKRVDRARQTSPERRAAMANARQRAAERRRRIEAGELRAPREVTP